MMDSETQSIQGRALDFVVGHPYVIIAIVVVLVVLVIGLFIDRSCGSVFKKRAAARKDTDADEIDDLITSIHNKQGIESG